MEGKIKLPIGDLQKLINTERSLNEALNQVQKLEECDIDCQEFRKQIATVLERSRKLRQNFGPESI